MFAAEHHALSEDCTSYAVLLWLLHASNVIVLCLRLDTLRCAGPPPLCLAQCAQKPGAVASLSKRMHASLVQRDRDIGFGLQDKCAAGLDMRLLVNLILTRGPVGGQGKSEREREFD